jgi:hypothetical protein
MEDVKIDLNITDKININEYDIFDLCEKYEDLKKNKEGFIVYCLTKDASVFNLKEY